MNEVDPHIEARLDEAKAALTQVLEKQPDSMSAHFDLGVIAERQGNIAEAASRPVLTISS